MTDARLRAQRRAALAEPGSLDLARVVREAERAGLEPLAALAGACDAAGRPRPVLWLCMQHAPGDPSGSAPWHRVSVDLSLVGQAGRILEGQPATAEESLLRAVFSRPAGGRGRDPSDVPYAARGLPLRSPCGSASYDVSQVRLAWRPGPADGAQGWCARCAPRADTTAERAWERVALLGDPAPTRETLERALGLALGVAHPWDRRSQGDPSGSPPWVLEVAGVLARRAEDTHAGLWLLRLAAARIPLEGAP